MNNMKIAIHKTDTGEYLSEYDQILLSKLIKLQTKLTMLEKNQEQMKVINAAWRRYQENPVSLDNVDLSDQMKNLIRGHQPRQVWNRGPFPDYKLTENITDIRNIKKQIETI